MQSAQFNLQMKYIYCHQSVQELLHQITHTQTQDSQQINTSRIEKLSCKVKALKEKVQHRNKKIKNMKELLKSLKEKQLIETEQHMILKHNFGGMAKKLFKIN